jgi:phage-related protein|tara:strand:- start:1514 stop:2398 length:885 start_codon:yes stop_codon:yes gene_type:complete
MVVPLVSLGLALSRVNTLASVGTSAISGMSSMISGIGSAFTKVFSWAIEKTRDAFNFIKDFWNEKVMPIFQPIINVFSFIWDTSVAIVKGAINRVISIWNDFVSLVKGFRDVVLDAFAWIINPDFSFLTNAWDSFTSLMSSVWSKTIGGLLDKISNINLFGPLQSAWDSFSSSVSSIGENLFDDMTTAVTFIYDKMVDIKNTISEIIDSTAGTILDVGKGAIDKVGGIFGGGGGGDTTTTVASGGAVTNNFNITIDVGGVTDRTDKLALAREIASLIQTETTRAYGGSTSVTRY